MVAQPEVPSVQVNRTRNDPLAKSARVDVLALHIQVLELEPTVRSSLAFVPSAVVWTGDKRFGAAVPCRLDGDPTIRHRSAARQAHVGQGNLETVDDERGVIGDLALEVEILPDLLLAAGGLCRVLVVVGERVVRGRPLPAGG